VSPETPDDVSFAARCAAQEPAALAEFDRRFSAVIDTTARRFGDASFATEVGQLVRVRLLTVADQGKARISEYSGRGDLEKFVQAVTARTALNHLSSHARAAQVQGDDALLALPGGGDDPEIAAMKARYRGEFKAAFARAMASLEDAPRAALRLHYLDGLTLAEIGALYQWSVPTASRRISGAREALLAATRQTMASELKLSNTELDSVLRLIESRLSVDGLVGG
jgi:RNA polymerase sigma-70 factor